MKIKQSVYWEITWEELKEMAISGQATEKLAPGDEIKITLENGEPVTVMVGDFLPKSEDKPCGVRFVFKDCLDEPHQMNKEWTNKGGYKASEGRRHILEDVYPLLPADLRAVIRPRKITEITNGETLTFEDPLWLPSETDMFGRGESSWQNGSADGPEDFQLSVYIEERGRVKQRKGYGTTPQWCRSVNSSNSYYFCRVNTDGSASNYDAYYSYALAPGFDI